MIRKNCLSWSLLPEQFPIEQGLKQSQRKAPTKAVDWLPEQFPIEQGLKLTTNAGSVGGIEASRAISNRTRIETRATDRHFPNIPPSSRAISNRTRIETKNDTRTKTNRPGLPEQFPIEQGLKRIRAIIGDYASACFQSNFQ